MSGERGRERKTERKRENERNIGPEEERKDKAIALYKRPQFADIDPNYCNSKVSENEVLLNFEQSSNSLSKIPSVVVKYQDVFRICIVSIYRNKTILQIAGSARQSVVK